MKLRFRIEQGGTATHTDWTDETVRHRQAGTPTAVSEVERLRTLHSDAAISVERDHVVTPSTPRLYRYEIFVPNGTIEVVDKDGKRHVNLTNATLQSRPFQQTEQETVLAEVLITWPNARVTLREVK